MAIEPYRARVSPTVTLTGEVNPAAFSGPADIVAGAAKAGASLIDQERQLGDQVDQARRRADEKEKQDRDSALHVERSVAYAEMTQRFKTRAVELQTAAGGVATLEKEWGTARDEFLTQFGENGEVRDRFIPNLATFGGELVGDAVRADIAANQKALAAASDAALDGIINRNMEKLDAMPQAFAEIDTLIDGQTYLPPAMNAQAKRAAKQKLALSQLRYAAGTGQHERVAKLLEGNGPFDALMDPEQVQALRNTVDAERNAAAQAERVAANAAQAEARMAVDLVQRQVAAGIDPTPAEIAAAQAAAKAAGLPLDSFDLAVIEQRVAVNRRFRGNPPLARAAIADLEARQQAGKASKADQVQLDQLYKLRDAKSEDEAAPLRDVFKQGAGGRIQAAAAVKGRSSAERYMIGERIKEGFGAYAVLPDHIRDIAIQGQDDRPHVKDQIEPATINPAFAAAMGSAGRQASGSQFGAVKDVATSIYAKLARERGETKFNKALFNDAVSRAMGGYFKDGVQYGGRGVYNGQPIFLPPGTTAKQFNAILNGADFSRARRAGQPVTKSYVLGQLHPVYLGPKQDTGEAQYGFADADGNRLMDVNGTPFTRVVRRK